MKNYVDSRPTGASMDFVNSSNTSMKNYVDSTNTSMKNYVDSSNTSIKNYVDSSNTSIKSYVDSSNTSMSNYVDGKFPAWTTWPATLTWSGNSSTMTISNSEYRYEQTGKLVFYEIYINCADSNAATLTGVSMPIASHANSVYSQTGRQLSGAGGSTKSIFLGYVYNNVFVPDTGVIAGTENARIEYRATGFYEAA
jgi:hypothetical protein